MSTTHIRRAQIAAAVVGLGLVGAAVASTAQAAITTYNPFDTNGGFTILVRGDARLANSELEGSVAALGTVSSDNQNGYPVIHQAAGQGDYTVPVVDGDPVRILAGAFVGTGSFDLANRDNSGTISQSSPEANATVRLADTTGLTAQVRGGGVGTNTGGNFPRVTNLQGGFLDLKAVPYDGFAVSDLETEQAAVADYFPGLEDQVARTDECLAAMYGNPELSHEVTVSNEGGLVYLSGFSTTMPNVIDYADVAGATLKMDRADGYVPTAEAPLVVRVPAGTTSIGRVNFEGWSSGSSAQQEYARYIMLDLSAVTGTVTVDGLEMGALWAPNATVEFASGITTNGQWFADDVVTTGGGEIHHHAFGGRLLCDDEEQPSPSPSPSEPGPAPSPSAPSPIPSEPSTAPSPSPSTGTSDGPTPSPSATPSPSPSPLSSSATLPVTPGGGSPDDGVPDAPDSDGPGALAVTGASVGVLIATAAAAVVVGALLIGLRRRAGR